MSNPVNTNNRSVPRYIDSASVDIHCSFLEELLVEEEDEQIHVDFGLIKHLHHGNPLELQLQEVLDRQAQSQVPHTTVWTGWGGGNDENRQIFTS